MEGILHRYSSGVQTGVHVGDASFFELDERAQ